jgi:hypothetical protein
MLQCSEGADCSWPHPAKAEVLIPRLGGIFVEDEVELGSGQAGARSCN